MKVNFWVNKEDDFFELDDDMTEEEIEEEFQSWFNGSVSCGWVIIEQENTK